MIEKQNNIWNKIEVNLPTNSKKKNFNKKNVIIKQIGKEIKQNQFIHRKNYLSIKKEEED